MQKKNYLTKEEQIIYATIKKTDIIDNSHIKEIFPQYSSKKINKICHNLISKGYLYPIKRGVYLIHETPSKKPLIRNPFKLAHHIHKGYVGFSSALRLYDLITYEPFTIFIVTTKKSHELQIGEYVFKIVSMGKKATGTIYYKNVYTSTIEKTIFDCFYKPQYAGGYAGFIQALTNINTIQWNQVLNYFERFASDALFQRTGYILELLIEKDYLHPPEYIMKKFKQHIGNTTKLVPTKTSKGTYIRSWKLVDNIGKKTLLSGV